MRVSRVRAPPRWWPAWASFWRPAPWRFGQSGPDKSADVKAAIDVTKPKNVILFIRRRHGRG